MDAVFTALFAVTALYVLFANLIYFRHVLPTLGETAKVMPSAQFGQMSRYVSLMDERREAKWFLPIVRRLGLVAVALASAYLALGVVLVAR